MNIMYLFCSNCKPIFTFCSFFAISKKETPIPFRGKGAGSVSNFDKWPNRRDGHVPFVHGVLAHEGLARRWAALQGGED